MQLYLDSYVYVSENGNEAEYKSESSINQQPIFAMPIVFISDDHRMKRIKYININLSLPNKLRFYSNKKLNQIL